MKPSWRCSNCGLNWPHYRQYERCLSCEGKCWTTFDTDASPMADLEAQQLANTLRSDRATEELRLGRRREFETYYANEVAVPRFVAELDGWLTETLAAKLG